MAIEAKRAWKTPQLTVVVRGTTEESVLSACKTFDTRVGPYAQYQQCATEVCYDGCFTISSS
jgi:hypothetical protein